MKTSLIVIGDEILSGRTTDLNAAWFTKFAFSHGLYLEAIYFIKDREEEMAATIKKAMNESDLVITTGGIGPTLDDLTKKVLAKTFHTLLIPRDDIAQIADDNYHRFGRVRDPKMNFYHHFPETFFGIKNPLGLAVGLGFFDEKNEKLILSAPGVPREFQAMAAEEFSPLIKKYIGKKLVPEKQFTVRTTNISEEKIFNELCPSLWEELANWGKVSSLPHTIGIDIVVTMIQDHTQSDREEAIKKIFLQSAINDFIWQFGNRPLPELILEKAREKKITFGFAESCTGGLVSSKITNLAGASDVFMGGIISYANEVKENILKVKKETLIHHGAVSKECAKEMALGLLNQLPIDIAISITGIAGPSGGSKEKPVGTVVIGVAKKGNEKNAHAQLFHFPGDRLRLKDRFSDRALLTLFYEIQSQVDEDLL